MEITSVSSPRNDFPGIPTRAEMFRGIWLSRNRVIEGSLSGTVVGRLFASSSAFALAVVSGPATINEDNELVLSSTAGDAGTTQTVRVSATRATPYLQIVQDLEVYADVTPFALNDLTLSMASYYVAADPGTVIGALGGLTSGSSVEIYPNDGRVALDLSGNLIVGLSAASIGSYSITVRESKEGATNAPKASTFTLTVTDVVAPAFTSSTVANVSEGGVGDIAITLNQPCDLTIVGGADQALFSLLSDLNTTDAVLQMESQDYSGVVSNDRVVILRATSVASGLYVEEEFTITVTDVASPVNSSVATIGGSLIEGYFLTATPGVWTGADVVTGQWKANGVAISGATGLVYRLALGEVGKTITYTETASNAGGSTTATSAATASVVSGIIARITMTDVSRDVSAATRWAEMISTDTYPTTHMPDAGIGKDDGTVGYTFGHVTGAGFSANQWGNAAFPLYLKGQANSTGGTGRTQYAVTPGVLIRVRLACGGGAAAGSNEWSIRDGDTSTELASAQASGMAADTVLGTDGLVYPAGNWFSEDPGIVITPTSSTIVIRRKLSGSLYSNTLRAIEISYPDYNVNTSTTRLAGNTVYVDAVAGNDITGDGTIGNPFKNLPGDPAAGGVVPAFVVMPGHFMKLQGGQRHRPASFSARNQRHLQTLSGGSVGLPVTIQSYGTGRAILDGSELVNSGWVSASADALVGSNPNAANIEKRAITGVTAFDYPLTDGDKQLYPAQWPVPTNPADWYRVYPGADGYIGIPYADRAKVVQGDLNTGTRGAGYRLLTVTSDTGANNLKDHYGPAGINVTSYRAVIQNGQNRLNEYTIDYHNPTTGEIRMDIENGNAIIGPKSGGMDFILAIRYHPFDLRKEGQYARTSDFTTSYGDFSTATRGIVRLDYGFYPAHDYVTWDGVDIERFYMAGVIDAPSGSGSISRSNISVKNTAIRSVSGPDILGAIRIGSAAKSLFAFENILVEDAQHVGAIQPSSLASGSSINGWTQKDAGRTSLYVGSPDWNATNINASDNDSVHGNGVAIYEKAARNQITQVLAMNNMIPFSTQQDGTVADRSLVVRNGVFIGKATEVHPGSSAQAGTIYAWQCGDSEINSLFEGLVFGLGSVLFGRSSFLDQYGNPYPDMGDMVVKNCILPGIAAVKLDSMTFENVLIMGNVGNVKTLGEFDAKYYDVAKAPVRQGTLGVDFVSTGWDGTITQLMQQFLTANGSAGTYSARNIGTSALPWNIAAYGTAFSLADVMLTSTYFRKDTRPDTCVASVVGSQPGSVITLPAAGDNAYFGMYKGQIYFVTVPAAGTYTLVVRQTSAHPDLTGSTTRDTSITITVY